MHDFLGADGPIPPKRQRSTTTIKAKVKRDLEFLNIFIIYLG